MPDKPQADKPPDPDRRLISRIVKRAGSAGINVGGGASVDKIVIVGNVVGGDIFNITEDLAYDVSDLGANPYPGLASYTYEKRAFYAGREPLVHDAVARLTAPGNEPVLVFVTGASGSGKSSFAQAGLLPQLEQAYSTQGRRVRWAVARPGRHPIEALGRAFRELGLHEPPDGDWASLLRTPEDLNHLLATQTPRDQVNVLIFDQFEELFTQADPTERALISALLSGLESFNHVRTQVVATLRPDYLSAVFDAPGLFERFKQHSIEVRAMAPDDLARAIRRPLEVQAQLQGINKHIQPALLARLVEDVGNDPTLLPLLQVTLQALWEEPPRRLVLGRYASLTHGMEQIATRVFEQDARGRIRTAPDREQLLGIFLDLVDVSSDADPRRGAPSTVPKRQLLEGHPERAELIEELIAARLLTASVEQSRGVDVDVVGIIHETLLRDWPRLNSEIVARREAQQQRQRFELALQDWLQSGRNSVYLLQGVSLAEARRLAERKDVTPQDPDRWAFLEASIAAEAAPGTRALRQARRRQRVLGAVAGVAIILAIAASLTAVVALNSEQVAQPQTAITER